MQTEDITKEKIQKATELICHLYFEELITDAYISGSVAKGTARKESDIDIFIINPLFEFASDDLAPSDYLVKPDYEDEEYEDVSKKLVYEDAPNMKLVSDYLQDLGAEFKIITKTKKIPWSEKEETSSYWHQLYEGEIFHLMLWSSSDVVTNFPDMTSMNISIDICLQLLDGTSQVLNK